MKSTNAFPFISFYERAASFDRIGMAMLRIGLIVVLMWIGALKFADYEADSIVPLVANSPIMGFVYAHPAPEYRAHMNKEGEAIPAHHEWQISNHTYPVSRALGCIIILIGLLIALHGPLPQVASIGSALLILMACTTLSFLVTTPEAWVPCTGKRRPRLSLPFRRWAAHYQRFHHARGGRSHHGRLGEEFSEAKTCAHQSCG